MGPDDFETELPSPSQTPPPQRRNQEDMESTNPSKLDQKSVENKIDVGKLWIMQPIPFWKRRANPHLKK